MNYLIVLYTSSICYKIGFYLYSYMIQKEESSTELHKMKAKKLIFFLFSLAIGGAAAFVLNKLAISLNPFSFHPFTAKTGNIVVGAGASGIAFIYRIYKKDYR